VLPNILTLLKPDGKLILSLAQSTEDSEVWGSRLSNCGFTGLDGVFRDETLSVVVSSAPSEDNSLVAVPLAPSSYFIVTDTASALQQQIADKLSFTLSARGH
jgi:hypothetical protein